MNHPPIPPNCLYFGPNGTFTSPCSGIITLSAMRKILDTPWIPIIAALARCAWLDEAVTRTQEREDEGYDTYVPMCHKNAAAWAEWGRGEPWE